MSDQRYYMIRHYAGASIAESDMNNKAKKGWRVHTIVNPQSGDLFTVFYEHPDALCMTGGSNYRLDSDVLSDRGEQD